MEVRAHQLPEVLCSYMYKRRECKGNDACNYWVPFCLYPSFFVRAQCLKLPIKCCVLVLGHCFFTAFPSTSLESGTAHCYAKRKEPDVVNSYKSSLADPYCILLNIKYKADTIYVVQQKCTTHHNGHKICFMFVWKWNISP